ncbi:DUF6268 family outer membrane beta-barrel protein [Aquimarina algiphila]|uniref:DUF6268 family outer membrane beta-barrel protein n=1 Tax=Aquimarina algiphila TaxID=2047982 RepID=UPI00249155CD|nr:DUF6268 family outer membrane beta-barrel protein [Aquimarina algiphila]
MQRCLKYIVLVFGVGNVLWAQNPDMEVAGFEYTVIPGLGEVGIEKYTANLNFGKKFNKSVLGFGASYDSYNFMFNNAAIDFDTQSYETIHTIKTRLFYRYSINNSWFATVLFSPSLSSNLEGSLSSEDLIMSSAATVSKSWDNETKSSVLTFGISFGTAFGKPQFIPVISYQKMINTQWSYNLGIPRTKLNYSFDLRHKVSISASFKGLFGNISSTMNFKDLGNLTDTKLQYNALDTSVEYNYRIQPNWTTVIRIGYSPWNQLKILDKENKEIYDFEIDNTVFISMGLKFNLNK